MSEPPLLRQNTLEQLFSFNRPRVDSVPKIRYSIGGGGNSCLTLLQTLHVGPAAIWSLEFSLDGVYLAVGCSTGQVIVYMVAGSSVELSHQSPRNPQSTGLQRALYNAPAPGNHSVDNESDQNYLPGDEDVEEEEEFLNPVCIREYHQHKEDVVDLSWADSSFLLSASLDGSARLWHVSKRYSVRHFVHSEQVTSACFHPQRPKLFVTGGFDGIVRLWDAVGSDAGNVLCLARVNEPITALAISPNGSFVVAGLITGKCVVYRLPSLSHYTEIDCRNKRGKFSSGRKVTGLKFESSGRHLLITTCDSRIRLYNFIDNVMVCKFKGHKNEEYPIRATLSSDKRHVICGSENGEMYRWKTRTSGKSDPDANNNAQTSHRFFRSKVFKNQAFEHFQIDKETSTSTTVSVYVPMSSLAHFLGESHPALSQTQLVITGSMDGTIRVFEISSTMNT